MGYNVTKIRRELAKKLDAPLTAKVISFVKQSIPYHVAKPDAEIKATLQGVYNELGITRTAKATDLRRWYEVKVTTPKINGISTGHTTIVCERVIVCRKPKPVQGELFEK